MANGFASQLISGVQQTTRDQGGDLQEASSLAAKEEQIKLNRQRIETQKVQVQGQQNDNFFKALERISKSKTPAERKFFENQAKSRYVSAQPNGNPANLDFLFADDELRRQSLATYQKVRLGEAGSSAEFIGAISEAFANDPEGYENAVNEATEKLFQTEKLQQQQKLAQTRLDVAAAGSRTRAEAAVTAKANTAFQKLAETLNNPSSRRLTGKLQGNIINADSVQVLADSVGLAEGQDSPSPDETKKERIKRFNAATKAQVAEVVVGLDRLISGSVPTIAGKETLTPNTQFDSGELMQESQKVSRI